MMQTWVTVQVSRFLSQGRREILIFSMGRLELREGKHKREKEKSKSMVLQVR